MNQETNCVSVYCEAYAHLPYLSFSSVQLLNHVWLFAAPWTAAHQASLSITNSWSLLKLMSIKTVMPPNTLISFLILLPFLWVMPPSPVARWLVFWLASLVYSLHSALKFRIHFFIPKSKWSKILFWSWPALCLIPLHWPQDEVQILYLGFKCSIESAGAAAAKLLQLCLTLCDPIDSSPPGSPVPGILQARTLEWVAISSSNAWKEKWNWSRLVVSDSSRPHGLQPTRLLRPWDFPGKSTGVGCHCLLRALGLPLFN